MVDILKNTVLITALLLATSTSVMATDNIASATVANIESTEVIAQKAKDEVKVEKTETIDANATKENKDKATVETTENGVKLENDIEGKNANLPSKKQESSKKESEVSEIIEEIPKEKNNSLLLGTIILFVIAAVGAFIWFKFK